MVALERWVQMEAAALLDANRERYGIAGGSAAAPAWWVTCEYGAVDIWLEGPTEAVAIELKAIHNNKNFYSKLAEVRSDLTPGLKRVPAHATNVTRMGIIVVSYARYLNVGAREFVPLRSSPRGPMMSRDEYLTELTNGLLDEDRWYGESARLRVHELREVASLEDAHYIEPGQRSAIWLGLVEADSGIAAATQPTTGNRLCPVCSHGVYDDPHAPMAFIGSPNPANHRCNKNGTWNAPGNRYGRTEERLERRLLETPLSLLADWDQVLALKAEAEARRSLKSSD
jgi:hypothetical protein